MEVSPKMRSLQYEKLTGNSQAKIESSVKLSVKGTVAQSKHSVPVSWYDQLPDVPDAFSIYIAHEFFDALPIHKIQVSHMGYLLHDGYVVVWLRT